MRNSFAKRFMLYYNKVLNLMKDPIFIINEKVRSTGFEGLRMKLEGKLSVVENAAGELSAWLDAHTERCDKCRK